MARRGSACARSSARRSGSRRSPRPTCRRPARRAGGAAVGQLLERRQGAALAGALDAELVQQRFAGTAAGQRPAGEDVLERGHDLVEGGVLAGPPGGAGLEARGQRWRQPHRGRAGRCDGTTLCGSTCQAAPRGRRRLQCDCYEGVISTTSTRPVTPPRRAAGGSNGAGGANSSAQSEAPVGTMRHRRASGARRATRPGGP